VILLDANVLIYAHNADAEEHLAARSWLHAAIQERQWIGLPWVTIWAFLRISTNARLFSSPIPLSKGFGIIHELLALPCVALTAPGARHLEIVERLAMQNRISGSGMTDVVLAALAVEHGATLISTDGGFARFRGLKWENPLSQEG
jgi:uncharacterized protein